MFYQFCRLDFITKQDMNYANDRIFSIIDLHKWNQQIYQKLPLSSCRNIWLIYNGIPFSRQNKCKGSVVSWKLVSLSLSLSLSSLIHSSKHAFRWYFMCMCFTYDDFMQWMLLTLTLINEAVFDDSIMNSYTYFYFHPNI